MEKTFLSSQEYSLKLNETIKGLGEKGTVEAARSYLEKNGVYKDTPENRAKHEEKKK